MKLNSVLLTEVRLSQMISSKICHDLSGSIGAIYNCADLLNDRNIKIKKSAHDICKAESHNLVNKINFFRIAYGMQVDSEISIVAITKLLQDFLRFKDLKIIVSFDDGIMFLEYSIAQAVLALIHIVSEKMFFEGKISLLIGKNIIISGEGNKLGAVQNELLSILKGNFDCNNKEIINIFNCREYYVNLLSRRVNYDLDVEHSDTNILYTFKKI